MGQWCCLCEVTLCSQVIFACGDYSNKGDGLGAKSIYAGPVANIHKYIWGNEMKVVHPWLVIGDFNCLLRGDECSSWREVSSCFVDWVELRGLINLGYSGLTFTWNHGMNIATRVSARLDRGLCDIERRRQFPSVSIKHLVLSYSDHCPILL